MLCVPRGLTFSAMTLDGKVIYFSHMGDENVMQKKEVKDVEIQNQGKGRKG
jgi:hypothetical protein